MGNLRRFGISIEAELCDRFDARLKARGCPNRSEGIRDLIQESLVAEEWRGNAAVAGGIVLVYDHHKRDLLARLTSLQHDCHELIVATQHVHLNHDTCLEVLIVKGPAKRLRDLFERLQAVKGLRHLGLTRTALA